MSEPQEVVVSLRDVTKTYRGAKAADHISLDLRKGEIVGLVGPNGSGKTTVLRMIAGLVRPTTGEIVVEGQSLTDRWGILPPNIGLVLDPPGMMPHLTGFQNLWLLASLRNLVGKQTVRAMMARLGLDPDDRRKVAAYSQGMRQKLGVAQALMEHPGVLLLDEPTNGLDEESVALLANILIEERERGVAILLVSHVREQIEILFDRVVGIESGRLKSLRQPGVSYSDTSSET